MSVLRISQITLRFWNTSASYTTASTFLKQLTTHEYLERFKRWGHDNYYGLSKKGVSFLRKQGMSIKYTPSEHAPQDSSQFRHLQMTNDAAISVAKLPVDYTVVERRHYINTPQKNRKVIPDLWVHIVHEDKEYALWLEIDRDTEGEEYFRSKMKNFIEYVAVSYRDEFSIPLKAMGFITVSEIRKRKLLEWLGKELKSGGKENYAHYFKVRNINEGTIDPNIFREYRWNYPFCDDPALLL